MKQGDLIRWASPPMVRVGAYGFEFAPSNIGIVSALIGDKPTHARFFFVYKGKPGTSGSMALLPDQPCEVDE